MSEQDFHLLLASILLLIGELPSVLLVKAQDSEQDVSEVKMAVEEEKQRLAVLRAELEEYLSQSSGANDAGSDSGGSGAIPGTPGLDYPVLTRVPPTDFSCLGRLAPGYYADVGARCQVFHICGVGGTKHSFLCSPGSVFNQQYLVCDWWYKARCEDAYSEQSQPQEEDFVKLLDDETSGDPLAENSLIYVPNDIFSVAETGVPSRDRIDGLNKSDILR